VPVEKGCFIGMIRYNHQDLELFGTDLLRRAGFEEEKARVTARLLLEADLMGHTTHGLQLCGANIKSLQSGDMRGDGDPVVLRDTGSTALWDAGYLPGPWVTDRAIRELLDRVGKFGMATFSIRRCGHLGCLQVFLPQATEAGCIILLSCSDPSAAGVAPYGGRDALFTPNPFAVGIPTDGDPILCDTSCSITTIGSVKRTGDAGGRMPGEWLLSAEGVPSDDPAVLNTDPRGTILPTGGLDHGHKGFALAIMVEALTQGLAGHGRADEVKSWGAGVFIQVIDPAAFGGREAFRRQTTWLAEACRNSAPRPGVDGVRLPGQAALAKKCQMLEHGVELHEAVVKSLETWGGRLGVAMPCPRADSR